MCEFTFKFMKHNLRSNALYAAGTAWRTGTKSDLENALGCYRDHRRLILAQLEKNEGAETVYVVQADTMLPRRLQWMSIRNSYSLRYLGVHSIWPQMTAMQDEAAAIEAITKQLAYSSPLAFATLREPLQTPVWFSSYSIISSTQRWYLLAADANSSGTHACRPWKTRTEYNIFTSIFAANLSIADVRQDPACISKCWFRSTLCFNML